MFKKIHRLAVIALCTLSCAAYCASNNNDDLLAERCTALAEILSDLADQQTTTQCISDLQNSTQYADQTSVMILAQEYATARFYIKKSINYLEHAETINCLALEKIILIENQLSAIKYSL